jgi:hypothetical protein
MKVMGSDLIFCQFSLSKAVFAYFELSFGAEPPP